ncbi:MAG: DUF4174 domain-containing protein [Candidatus Methylacidiphilales bacterium]|nr:DUF4174 domain-containing protein [Candidatus Methylacidiphilales bacterium]
MKPTSNGQSKLPILGLSLVILGALSFSVEAAPSGQAPGTVPSVGSLGEFRWKNRVLVVRATDDEAALIRKLEQAAAAFRERDLVWFLIRAKGVESNTGRPCTAQFRSQLEKITWGETPWKTVLIGKDGGVKAKSKTLEVDAILAQIEAMPMRQQEMREIKEN